jgi:hypothetical protein
MTGRRKRELALAALLVGAAVNGCATTETPDDLLLRRAASDLPCTRDEMRVNRIDEKTRRVWGCGHQARYVYVCAHPDNPVNRVCSWLKTEPPEPPPPIVLLFLGERRDAREHLALEVLQ